MVRLIGITFVFIGCVLGGIWKDLDQKKRIEELEKFGYMLEMIKAEIDYKLSPLKEACSMVASRIDNNSIVDIINRFKISLDEKETTNVGDMWKNAIDSEKNKLHLKDEDIKVLYQFGIACGHFDKNMEKRNIDMVISSLNEIVSRAKEEYVKESKLNKSLGILIGLGISIFLL